MKNKRIITILLLIVMVILEFSFIMQPTRADSGYDSSYSSGSSSSSSSSSSHSRNSINLTDGQTIMLLLVTCAFFGVLFFYLANEQQKKINLLKKVTQDDLNKIDPSLNREELIKETYELYKTVQIAWMNFDYKTLEENLTDELYNNYKMLLDTAKQKGEQNIMECFTFHDGGVSNVEKNGNKITIDIYLAVSVRDYIIVQETKKIVRGNLSKHLVTYVITIVKDLDSKDKCSSCGATIKRNNHQTCSHCGSTITRKSNKFVMSKKKVIEI